MNSQDSHRIKKNERTRTSPNYDKLDRVYYVKKAMERSKSMFPDKSNKNGQNRFSIQLSERGVNALPEILIPDGEVDQEIEKELTYKLQTDRVF
jgi:hypothetical protein